MESIRQFPLLEAQRSAYFRGDKDMSITLLTQAKEINENVFNLVKDLMIIGMIPMTIEKQPEEVVRGGVIPERVVIYLNQEPWANREEEHMLQLDYYNNYFGGTKINTLIEKYGACCEWNTCADACIFLNI
jgi:hypothetical protein